MHGRGAASSIADPRRPFGANGAIIFAGERFGTGVGDQFRRREDEGIAADVRSGKSLLHFPQERVTFAPHEWILAFEPEGSQACSLRARGLLIVD